MTPTDLTPIVQQATKNQAAGWGWVFLHPQQVLELAELTAAYLDAQRRLDQIAILAEKALFDWACNYRPDECEKLHQILALAKGE